MNKESIGYISAVLSFIIGLALVVGCGQNKNEKHSDNEKRVGGSNWYPLFESDVYEGDIHYKVFYFHNGGVSTVNYTQDSLNFVKANGAN